MRRELIIYSYPEKLTLGQLESIYDRRNAFTVEDKKILLALIEHKLEKRFFDPINNVEEEHISSFHIMAICCLVIETLECFYQGEVKTPSRQGKTYFKSYFKVLV